MLARLVLALILAQTSFIVRSGQTVIVTVIAGDVFLLVREEKETETTFTRIVYRDVFAVDYPVRSDGDGVWTVYVTARLHRPFEQRVECRGVSSHERRIGRLAVSFDNQSAAVLLVQGLVDRFEKRLKR